MRKASWRFVQVAGLTVLSGVGWLSGALVAANPVTAAEAVQLQAQPDAYAVIIGIEKYRAGFPPATAAEQDARAFRDLVVRTLGVPEENVRLLVGSEAAKSDIEAVLEEWLPKQPRASVSNTYFFYSGHGAPDPLTGEGYIVPFDGDPAYLRTKAISLRRVYDLLGRVPASRTLAFIDSCFSGSGGRSLLPAGTRPLVNFKPTTPTIGPVVALTASTGGQISGATADGKHGLFTHHLLEGVAGGADTSGDSTITMKELHGYVRAAVARDARRANRDQTPELLRGRQADPGAMVLVTLGRAALPTLAAPDGVPRENALDPSVVATATLPAVPAATTSESRAPLAPGRTVALHPLGTHAPAPVAPMIVSTNAEAAAFPELGRFQLGAHAGLRASRFGGHDGGFVVSPSLRFGGDGLFLRLDGEFFGSQSGSALLAAFYPLNWAQSFGARRWLVSIGAGFLIGHSDDMNPSGPIDGISGTTYGARLPASIEFRLTKRFSVRVEVAFGALNVDSAGSGYSTDTLSTIPRGPERSYETEMFDLTLGFAIAL